MAGLLKISIVKCAPFSPKNILAQMKFNSPTAIFGALVHKGRCCASWVWRLEARLKGAQFQGTCVFIGRPMISIEPGGRIIFGDGVRVGSSRRENPLGLAQPSALRVMDPGAQLILGANVGLSGVSICASKSIEIGEGTILGAGAMVIDNDFHFPAGEWGWTSENGIVGGNPVKIGRGVFIGARAIILKGVTIGDRAVIGAGAVVSKDVPARHFAVGNPARILPPKTI
jgi:acetyltransferase-like isoleucine patch superfamily enzyme